MPTMVSHKITDPMLVGGARQLSIRAPLPHRQHARPPQSQLCARYTRCLVSGIAFTTALGVENPFGGRWPERGLSRQRHDRRTLLQDADRALADKLADWLQHCFWYRCAARHQHDVAKDAVLDNGSKVYEVGGVEAVRPQAVDRLGDTALICEQRRTRKRLFHGSEVGLVGAAINATQHHRTHIVPLACGK